VRRGRSGRHRPAPRLWMPAGPLQPPAHSPQQGPQGARPAAAAGLRPAAAASWWRERWRWHERARTADQWRRSPPQPRNARRSGTPRACRAAIFGARATRQAIRWKAVAGDRGETIRFQSWAGTRARASGVVSSQPKRRHRAAVALSLDRCSDPGRPAPRANDQPGGTDRGPAHVRGSRACGRRCRAAAAWGSSSRGPRSQRYRGPLDERPVAISCKLGAAPPQQWGRLTGPGACQLPPLGLQQPGDEAR